jgi:type II secretory pathway pseudopilin PulG
MLEMITVVVMIGILSVILLANTQVGNRRQQLRDAADAYVSAAHHAESMASGAEAVTDSSGQKTSRKAYGVCITSSQITNTPANPNRCKQVAPGQKADMFQVYARELSETSPTVENAVGSQPNQPSIISSTKLPKNYSFITYDVWLDYVPPVPTLYTNGQQPPSGRDIIIGYKNLTELECRGNADCRFIHVRPVAGAVYVQ